MKIAVLGAGAMGCLYGGLLAEDNNEVWLLDIWKEHVDSINNRGLRMEGISGDRTIKGISATTDAQQIGRVDLLIVFVKSTATDIAVNNAKLLLDNNTVVLTLQNGLGNIEKIEEAVGKGRVIGGVTSHGSTLMGPGHIRHAGRGDTYIGEMDGSPTDRLKNIMNTFVNAGIECKLANNISSLIWSKLIVNVGINALTAITGLKNGRLVEYRHTEDILEAAVSEALEVAVSNGIVLQYQDPIAHVKEICRLTAENRSSMLQDVLKKQQTEIKQL